MRGTLLHSFHRASLLLKVVLLNWEMAALSCLECFMSKSSPTANIRPRSAVRSVFEQLCSIHSCRDSSFSTPGKTRMNRNKPHTVCCGPSEFNHDPINSFRSGPVFYVFSWIFICEINIILLLINYYLPWAPVLSPGRSNAKNAVRS